MTIEFLYGLVFGVAIVAVPAYRLASIARETVKLREAEVMAAEKALSEERRIPKKRPRGTPNYLRSAN
jgi:hypothetical protein